MSIVVLGDGLLGAEIVKQTQWHYISRKKDNIKLEDLTRENTLLANYETIVNCIADTDSYSVVRERVMATNFQFPIKLSNYCQSGNKKLVQISTDFVYANNSGKPTESALPQPDLNWYAYSKLLTDEYIQATNSNYLICRETHKKYPFDYPQVWDIKISGDTVDKIATLIVALIKKNASGVFNVGTGDKSLSDINPHGQVVAPPPNIPRDTRMDLTKLQKFLQL